jgi:hypothetical protein
MKVMFSGLAPQLVFSLMVLAAVMYSGVIRHPE